MTSNANDLVRRMDRLEKENRRLKRWGGALLAAVGCLGLTAMIAPTVCKTVWAERLVLKDSSGRDRLLMDAYTSGSPTVTFTDSNGRVAARLAWDGGVAMEFFGAQGEVTGRVRVDEKGRAQVESECDADDVAALTK